MLQALFGDLVFLLHVLPLIWILAEKFLFFYAKFVLLLFLDLEGVQDNFISHSLFSDLVPLFLLNPDGEDEVVV